MPEMQLIMERTSAEATELGARGEPAAARRVLADGIRQLRELKRQLTATERIIRAHYQDARQQNRQSGQTIGLFVGSKGRGALARGRAAGARGLAAQQANELRPYAQAKLDVDNAIAHLDTMRARLAAASPAPDRYFGSAPSARAAAPSAPPGWHPDPFGRFEWRWWDGTGWTEQVARSGVRATDHIGR